MGIPTVDLRGVSPGTPGWEAARAAVTTSMVAYGCVVVAHGDDDALGPDLLRPLFDRTLPELFALPVESKKGTAPIKGATKQGLRSQINGVASESIGIKDAADRGSVRAFADVLWPEGNPEFCETIVSFAKHMLKLNEILETLVLEGLGAGAESVRAHLDWLGYSVQLTHYGAPPPDTKKTSGVSMQAHYDDTMVTMILQHEVEGLEVRLGDGRWVAVPPEPGTFTLIAGELLRVATNGRVPACFHRVRTPSNNRERFSVLLVMLQKPGIEVRALDDLVDEEHPLTFNPLKHEEYSEWRYSEEGSKVDDALKAFCGVGQGSIY